MNGEFLRGAYVKSGFLTGNYSHQEVFIRSDGEYCWPDVDRSWSQAYHKASIKYKNGQYENIIL